MGPVPLSTGAVRRRAVSKALMVRGKRRERANPESETRLVKTLAAQGVLRKD